MIPVIVVVAASTFFMMSVAPGGPWDREKPLPPQAVANLNRMFGLDKPKWVNVDQMQASWDDGDRNPLALVWDLTDSQFLNYIKGVATGDLGPTYESQGAESVQDVIADQFPISMRIGLVGILFAVLVGVPLGIFASLRQNTWVDYVSMFTSTIGISVPTFVSGLLLLIFFSRNFGVSPIKRPEAWEGIFSTAYILPGIVLGLGTMAYITRLTRASMLEVMKNDYVRTARAKGLRERVVIIRHMLRNALIPVITIIGPAAADLVTGSIIIETIFNAPGLGREFVNSIGKRDYSMIMGITIFYAVLIATANVLVDLSYGLIDPRIRRR
ncbi:MAG: ABC transporter permease [Chloroflexota bacterium]|nr:ABC transporter permease [Chloroflexota bacterium]